MRILKTAAALGACTAAFSLLLLPSAIAQTASTAESQAFQLQYLLRLPNLESKQLVQQVSLLGNNPNGDPVAAAMRIAALDKKASSLRALEATDYADADTVLTSMSAPSSMRSWARSAAAILEAPVVLTKSEQKTAKTDPHTADLLGVMDEADIMKTETDSEEQSIATWLSLTRGRNALWAANVGEIAASLESSLDNGTAPQFEVSDIRNLADNAPTGTPLAARSALKMLLPQGGNLSSLVPGTTAVTRENAAQALKILRATFGAESLPASMDFK